MSVCWSGGCGSVLFSQEDKREDFDETFLLCFKDICMRVIVYLKLSHQGKKCQHKPFACQQMQGFQ